MQSPFRLGDWLVEPQLDQLTRGDQKIKLEPQVMKLLAYLAEYAGEVIPKERIIRDVWDDAYVTDEVLANGIWELRKALGDDAKNPRFIQTVPKKGYRLIAECHPLDTSQDSKKQIARRLLTVAMSLSAVLAVAVWLLVSRESVNPLDSVAVLPLENLSGNPEQDYFADGMTDELIAQLAQIRNLNVIPRTSVMRYWMKRTPTLVPGWAGSKRSTTGTGRELWRSLGEPSSSIITIQVPVIFTPSS